MLGYRETPSVERLIPEGEEKGGHDGHPSGVRGEDGSPVGALGAACGQPSQDPRAVSGLLPELLSPSTLLPVVMYTPSPNAQHFPLAVSKAVLGT